jgi:predicted PurR-regulated permease PerM
MRISGPASPSPPWGANVKLVVGLTLVVILGAFLVRFQSIIAPLLLTFILVYLLRPLAVRMSTDTRLSWRMAVNIIFIALVILVVTAFTLTGVAVVQQMQSLIDVIQDFVTDLPDILLDISTRAYLIGPFRVEMSDYLAVDNLEAIANQVLDIIQPILGRAGSLLGTVASGTATFIGWGFFIILISYFILADMGQVSDQIVKIELPGYDSDIRRLGREISRTWNAFLRGQVIMFTLSTVTYTIIFTVLGVRNVLALALVSGLARFVPLVGQWVNWAVILLVTIFQKSNYFGLEPMQYVLLVFFLVLIVDQIFDNVISPRILGRSLGVHPAAVMVAAIIAASLLGIIGIILAAPGLATLTLLVRYVIRKMLDLDPWPEDDNNEQVLEYPWVKWVERIKSLISAARGRWGRKK